MKAVSNVTYTYILLNFTCWVWCDSLLFNIYYLKVCKTLPVTSKGGSVVRAVHVRYMTYTLITALCSRLELGFTEND